MTVKLDCVLDTESSLPIAVRYVIWSNLHDRRYVEQHVRKQQHKMADLTCVHRRGKTCFCCAPRKGNEVQLKLQTSAKDCTHLINSEISNVYCNATLTYVAKTERKTIIIEQI